MKVGQVMTRNVRCTSPDATLKEAARVMCELDVGPLPVCENDRIVGIITDRDVTVRATAQGLDPNTTPVRDVMTKDLVYVFEDDNIKDAACCMQDQQVRRLLVLNRDKRLVGIVSIGDVATHVENDRLTGQTLEKISEPGPLHNQARMLTRQQFPWGRRPHAAHGRHGMFSMDRAGELFDINLLIGAGLGAGLMFMLDPQMGRRRRKLLADQAVSARHHAEDAMGKTWRDVRNRAQGAVAETSHLFRKDEPAPDHVIHDRVRSVLGRYCSHPHAVHVTAEDGHVTLTGPILCDEVRGLLSAVQSVRGVHTVDNKLDPHDEPGNISALQGGRQRTGETFELLQANWSPTTRMMACALGTTLLGVGMTQRLPTAMVLGTIGGALCLSSVMNTHITDSLHVSDEWLRGQTHQWTDWMKGAQQAFQKQGPGRTEPQSSEQQQPIYAGAGGGEFPAV